VRILLLSNMYPSAERPDFGVFVQRLEEALRSRGNEIERAVIDDPSAGPLHTPAKYLGLARRARTIVRRARPDVIYAHYLVPTGLVATTTRVPFVITVHGREVENADRHRILRPPTRFVLRRAAAVICVSSYLAERLPERPDRLEVIDCGVDVRAFPPAPKENGSGPRFLFVGSLSERKNLGRLMEAFRLVGAGTLTVVGSGPLEEELRARAPAGVTFRGRLPAAALVDAYAQADVVCQPSLVEPQGQALLEALSRGRPVVATRIGGPPEYVTPECGALVDPYDVRSIASGLRRAAELPVPCEAGIAVARAHDVSIQAARIEDLLRAVSSDRNELAERPPP
jgi:glycosyltransferase involved in cell wall biosynthesis